jgi:hypothetical protein
MTTESYTGIDTIAECQAAFQAAPSVSERAAGRLLIAGRKLADEIDRRDNQLAEALALVDSGEVAFYSSEAVAKLRAVLTRHLAEQADALRQRAYALYRRSDHVLLVPGDRVAIDRVAALREEGDALIAQADRLDPANGRN